MPGVEIPFPCPIYASDGLRRVEAAAATLGGEPLMQRAGAAAALHAQAMLGGDGTRVLVIAGPGNNGGDAFVVAERLKRAWYGVDLVFLGDAARLSPDARGALEAWRSCGGRCLDGMPEHGQWGLAIDGLFGIGLTRPPEAVHANAIARINRLNCPVLALDVPSGLSADGGEVLGCAVRATRTVTFLALKPGLLTADGPDHCGEICLETLGVDAPTLCPPDGWLLDRPLVANVMPRRPLNSHKGLFGSVGVIGGAAGMVGATTLAARAALKLGAGRVYLGALDPHVPAVDPAYPEIMLRAPEVLLELPGLDALVCGPGLGRSPAGLHLLERAIETPAALVLDADALNLLAAHPELMERVSERSAATLLTPHPAEAARLIGAGLNDVRYQRTEVAVMLASRLNAITVLKGVGSIVAQPNGTWYVNTSGNPGLASAGTGDVLAGMLGALLAQGLAPRDASLLGTHLHGAAADALVDTGNGPIGLAASELMDAARRLLNQWVYG